MPRFKKLSMREQGMETFMNTTFPNLLGKQYPNIAYILLLHLIKSGVNNTDIGKIFNGRTPGVASTWKTVVREEQDAGN